MKNKIVLTKKQYNLLKTAYRVIGFSFVVITLLIFAILIKKPIEFICIFCPYFLTKGLYRNQWHSDSLKQCLILSLGLFCFALSITLPKTFSIEFSLIIGLLLAYLSCKAGEIKFKLKDYAFIEPRYNQLKEWYEEQYSSKTFNTETCSKEELIVRCNELNFSEENTFLAIEFFIKKTKQSIIAEKLCIEEPSVARKKLRLKQKLNRVK